MKSYPSITMITGHPPLTKKSLTEFGASHQPLLLLPSINSREKIRFSPPLLGAVILASHLQSKGARCTVKDFYADAIDYSESEIFGISSTFMNLQEIKTIAARIRSENETAVIILGGPGSWSYPPELVIKELPEISAVIWGEGEQILLDYLSSLPSEPRMPSSLRRRSQRIPAMLQAESNMEINDIPFPDWSLIDLSNRLKVLPLETSRGCPYQCAYCSETLFWGKPVRYKEISKVVAEIINDVRRFNINTFRIVDSCFSSPANRCAELCDAIHDRCIKKGMDIHWTSYARLNNLSESLLKKMKNAGCVALDVGWESGDPEIAARMGKHYDPKALVDVMRTAKERNIIINCNVLIGFPGETEETINKTAELIEQAQPDTYTCFMLFVAPHTRLWENRSQFGLEGNRECIFVSVNSSCHS
jgi:radical SAM superfamily enzyme YgiQ (UPF0313 family)